MKACLETLDVVQKMEAKLFIPAHAELTDDIAPLAKLNQEKVREIGEAIREICGEPASAEQILNR